MLYQYPYGHSILDLVLFLTFVFLLESQYKLVA